jgi:hypothetical protein
LAAADDRRTMGTLNAKKIIILVLLLLAGVWIFKKF